MKLTFGKVVLFLLAVWLVASFLPIPPHVLEHIELVAIGASYFWILGKIVSGGRNIGPDGLAKYKIKVQQQTASQTFPQCGKADYISSTYKPQGTDFVIKQLFFRTPHYRESPVEYGEDAMTQFTCNYCGHRWKITHSMKDSHSNKTASLKC